MTFSLFHDTEVIKTSCREKDLPPADFIHRIFCCLQKRTRSNPGATADTATANTNTNFKGL